jgi:hypothetical protein
MIAMLTPKAGTIKEVIPITTKINKIAMTIWGKISIYLTKC